MEMITVRDGKVESLLLNNNDKVSSKKWGYTWPIAKLQVEFKIPCIVNPYMWMACKNGRLTLEWPQGGQFCPL